MKCTSCEETLQRVTVLEAALAIRSYELRRIRAGLVAIIGSVSGEVPDPREPDWLDELEEDEGGGTRVRSDDEGGRT